MILIKKNNDKINTVTKKAKVAKQKRTGKEKVIVIHPEEVLSEKSLASLPKTRKKRLKKSTTLTGRQQSLVNHFVAGHKLADCYELAGYSCKGWTRENKSGKAKLMLALPHLEEEVKRQRDKIARSTRWKREDSVKHLSRVVNDTPDMTFGGGNQIVNAVKELNKMHGFDKPEEEVTEYENSYEIKAKHIGKDFVDLHREITDGNATEIWLEGGRGSTKSSYASLQLLELLQNNRNMCMIIIRKVGNTIESSVFSQMKWALEIAGLSDNYKCTKSPYQIEDKKTGQIIYFRGADDPGKIKSIRPPMGMHLGIQWYEEFDQMNGMAEVRQINQSITRGGDRIYRIYSYNTPKSMQHFVNVEKVLPKKGKVLHKSCYLNAPKQWLGQPFFDEADYLKQVNENAYRHEYLGEAVGEGGKVFDNIEIREIPQEEINTFNQQLRGLDWGWYPDPLHYGGMYYMAAKRTLYITTEYRANRKGNRQVYEELKQLGYINNGSLIVADSAEPKSIKDFDDYGAFIQGANKFPGSVEAGNKWLASLVKIVIDPIKCPHTAKEFLEYEHPKDKDGNYISGYVDKNNHAIDMTRYATQPVWQQAGK